MKNKIKITAGILMLVLMICGVNASGRELAVGLDTDNSLI
jgi:hypothetical protein